MGVNSILALKPVRGFAIQASVVVSLAGWLMTVFIATAAAERAPVKTLLEMRRDKVVVQEWDISCGAAALTTLLNYQHGDMVTEREVALALVGREEYLRDPNLIRARQGFSLLDLKRYVDRRGYIGSGFGKLDLDDLKKRAPIIVPVVLDGYNHFVIFRGVMGDRVLLADPGFGNRTVPVSRFMDGWPELGPLGRVGFVVERTDGLPPPNQLAPRPDDFVFLR